MRAWEGQQLLEPDGSMAPGVWVAGDPWSQLKAVGLQLGRGVAPNLWNPLQGGGFRVNQAPITNITERKKKKKLLHREFQKQIDKTFPLSYPFGI